MNVLLLGNGFDLNYQFPTRYSDFLQFGRALQTIDLNCYNKKRLSTLWESLACVGDASSNCLLSLYRQCRLRKIDLYLLDLIKAILSKNEWFCFMLAECDENTCAVDEQLDDFAFQKRQKEKSDTKGNATSNKQTFWIDFEKEIKKVILTFENFLKRRTVWFSKEENEEDSIFVEHLKILFNFPSFFDIQKDDSLHSPIQLKENYVISLLPHKHQYDIPNSDKIISDLFTSLQELAFALVLFLYEFIDRPLTLRAKEGDCLYEELMEAKYTLSLNYTHTFEQLYESNKVYHLHGELSSTKKIESIIRELMNKKKQYSFDYLLDVLSQSDWNRIILGVNSDDSDISNDGNDSPRCSFIRFKKYFQRVVLRTDNHFIELLDDFVFKGLTEDRVKVIVFGHSLDRSDEDIIKPLFKNASSIVIYYYDQSDLESKVANLISIYGKDNFDKLRVEQQLSFKSMQTLTRRNTVKHGITI